MKKNKLITTATLGDIIELYETVQPGSGWQAILTRFFGGTHSYDTIEETVGPYHHALFQHTMKEFFVSKKCKEVEVSKNRLRHAPRLVGESVFEEIEYDLGKTFRGYKSGTIGYEMEDGSRIILVISRHGEESIYCLLCQPKNSSIMKEWGEYASKHNYYKGKKITADGEFLDLKDLTWDDVILPSGIKGLLRSMVGVTLNNIELLVKNGLSAKRGILMHGKPGTGKTTVVKVVAKEVPDGVTVILASPASMQQASDVKRICTMARELAPCVLVIEDIDWIAEDRNSGDGGRVIELMNQLDGVEDFANVLTLATTNDLEKIEGAIKNRPGRFDRVIDIPNPDEDCRKQLIRLFTKKWVLKDVDIDRVAKVTENLSGAHMADLCRTAAEKAIAESSLTSEGIAIVTDIHFGEAVKEVKNKDYTTYFKVQGKKRMGFNEDDDDLPWR